MLRIVTGCAVLLGLTAFAAATPQIDCTVQALRGADRGLLSLDDTVFEIVLDEHIALEEGLWTPDAFCAIQDDDFVAFILPVPRLPDEMPASPTLGVDGDMIEPWTAQDPWNPADRRAKAPADDDDDEALTTTTVVERADALAWHPSGLDEPAPSPSRDPDFHIAGGGCSTTPGESPAWWGLLALLALARRRDAR